MSESSESHVRQNEHGALALLEKGDGLAHMLVSLLLLMLAIAILLSSTYDLVAWIARPEPPGSFANRALGYLSDLLFGVIVLEVLSTLLTYIKSRSLESTIKDFLVVGIISSVRKVLLVGAHSSLDAAGSTEDFVKESIGTGITIVGILLLIVGLLLVERRGKWAESREEARSPD